MVDFASDLVAIESENPPGREYAVAARRLAQRLGELGLSPRTINPSRKGPCVVASYGAGDRALYFSGHYDVVPAQDRAQFTPVVKKGNLHGRGAADMKGGIASMIFAIHALKSVGFEPKGRLLSVSVPDEETSGPHGTMSLVRAGLVEPNAIGMLTMEPTSGVVWNANRGVLSLRVMVRGKPAHVGLHFKGVNAFVGMLELAKAFHAYGRRVSQRRTAHEIEPAAARRSILLMGGEVTGGHNFNVVPDVAGFTIDRRPNPEEDFDAERDALFAIVETARARGIDCSAHLFQEGRSAATTEASPLGSALRTNIRAVTHRPARFELCPGVLETRHYAALGIPAMAYGPGLLSVSHGPHEFVSIQKMLDCSLVYALTAARLLS